jgi:long-chain acyl-CoA synthetase
MNIFDVIEREGAGRLKRPAVIGGGRELSYGTLFSSVHDFAKQLASFGIGSTQRVALLCCDSIEYIIVALAVLSLRAAIVPLSPSHSRDEVEAILAELDVTFLISDVGSRLSDHDHPIASGDNFESTVFLRRCTPGKPVPEEYSELNPAFIRFSSGTTAARKGVVLSHETILERTDAADKALQITERDRVIWVLSMSFHFVVSILLFLRRGATIILCGSAFPSSLIDGLVRHHGTFIYASPLHYRAIASSTACSAEMFSGVRLAVSTAMGLPEVDSRRFYEAFRCELAQAYGIIEVGLPFVNCSKAPEKRGSVGSVLPDFDVRIINPDADGIGEVQITGKGMFDAYFSPWQRRDQALRNGWFETGDLGRIDSDGFLFLSGRQKNVINFAGMKLFPDEVESVLNRHPLVSESLVYATAHPQYGELPCADIVLRGDTEAADIDMSEIRRFCYQHLAPYKVPKELHCVAHLDKTASGKLRRWGRTPQRREAKASVPERR